MKHVLRPPIFFRIVGIEASLLGCGSICIGMWFNFMPLFFDNSSNDYLIAIVAVFVGTMMIIGGIYILRYFMPVLFHKIIITDETITWKCVLFRKNVIKLSEVRYTDVKNFDNSPALVPYFIVANSNDNSISLHKLKRSKNLMLFQLHKKYVPVLYSSIPKPYNQILSRYLYKTNK